MLAPAATGSGESVFVTETSAQFDTFVVVLSELFPGVGSDVDELTDAVFVIVQLDGLDTTLTTSVKDSVMSPIAPVLVQLTVPVPPTDGIEQFQSASFA